MSIIKTASLKIPVPIKSIQKEIESPGQHYWKEHINKHDYEGGWDVLSFRSPGGGLNTLAESLNNEMYADTPLLAYCPAVRALLDSLACEKLSVRLLNLHAGAVIKEHTDKELYFEKGEARLHFPIITNPLVEFYLDNERIQMQEGECWYINANLPHRLANKGNSNRIHLVVDCKVNEWLQNIFQYECIKKSELGDKELMLRNKEQIIQTIDGLRRQPGSTAADLANKLEHELNEAMSDPTVNIINFIRGIGIAVHEELIEEKTFLPGMKIRNGELVIDKTKSFYPGDLLHEAGHIAVASAIDRPYLDEKKIGESANREAEEMMAIAWSYAATVHLDIDPSIVFHDDGYKGGGSSIAENFKAGHYFGTPMLQWCGMTNENVFPAMKKWLRE